MRKSDQLQIGKAGEYITCGDLIIKGLIAYPSEQGLPYDVVIDNGKKLLKCQVKTTLQPRIIPQRSKKTLAYIFNIKRHGTNNQKIYTDNEVDVFALVCLDTKRVGYIKNCDMPTTINIRVDDMRGKYYDEKGIKDYESVMRMRKETNYNQTKIARVLNIHTATVNRMLKSNYVPFVTGARYFNEFEQSFDWFLKL